MLLEEPVLLELLEPESEVLGVGHLDVVQKALLVVDVHAADLRLGRDDAEADVDAAVGAAAGNVGRRLAVDQHAVLQDEVPEEGLFKVATLSLFYKGLAIRDRN